MTEDIIECSKCGNEYDGMLYDYCGHCEMHDYSWGVRYSPNSFHGHDLYEVTYSPYDDAVVAYQFMNETLAKNTAKALNDMNVDPNEFIEKD